MKPQIGTLSSLSSLFKSNRCIVHRLDRYILISVVFVNRNSSELVATQLRKLTATHNWYFTIYDDGNIIVGFVHRTMIGAAGTLRQSSTGKAEENHGDGPADHRLDGQPARRQFVVTTCRVIAEHAFTRPRSQSVSVSARRSIGKSICMRRDHSAAWDWFCCVSPYPSWAGQRMLFTARIARGSAATSVTRSMTTLNVPMWSRTDSTILPTMLGGRWRRSIHSRSSRWSRPCRTWDVAFMVLIGTLCAIRRVSLAYHGSIVSRTWSTARRCWPSVQPPVRRPIRRWCRILAVPRNQW